MTDVQKLQKILDQIEMSGAYSSTTNLTYVQSDRLRYWAELLNEVKDELEIQQRAKL